jgi:hypothetical protein
MEQKNENSSLRTRLINWINGLSDNQISKLFSGLLRRTDKFSSRISKRLELFAAGQESLSVLWLIFLYVLNQTLVILFGGALILLPDQSRDMFDSLSDLSGQGWQFVFFAITTVLWSLSLWYSARILLILLEIKVSPSRKDFAVKAIKWTPITFGLMPYIIDIVAFAAVGKNIRPIFLLLLLASFFLWTVLHKKRHTKKISAPKQAVTEVENSYEESNMVAESMQADIESMPTRTSSPPTPTQESYIVLKATPFSQLKGRKWVLVFLILALLLYFISLMGSLTGVRFFDSANFGPAAILGLGLTALTIWTSFAFYFQVKYKLPLLLFWALWLLFCSRTNNDHVIIPSPEKYGTKDTLGMTTHFSEWAKAKQLSKDSTTDIFIAAVEGGGIRALSWTAGVLNKLEDSSEYFHEHLYAITGASGGMVGATFQQAYRRDHLAITEAEKQGFNTMITRDYLSNLLSAFLFTDFAQLHIPFAVSRFDRAKALEYSWEKGFEEAITRNSNNSMMQPFMKLWEHDEDYNQPSLFINGTVMETGQKAIYSNVRLEENYFPNVADLHKEMGGDVKLSTAALFAARFPYITPPGTITRFENGKIVKLGNILDGGYQENTGIESAISIIDCIRDVAKKQGYKVNPVLVFIKNSSFDITKGNHALPTRDKYSDLALDAKAPILGILSVQDQHGLVVFHNAELLSRKGDFEFLTIELDHDIDVRLPLGWFLSKRAKEKILGQVDALGNDLKILSNHELAWKNQAVFRRLISQ